MEAPDLGVQGGAAQGAEHQFELLDTQHALPRHRQPCVEAVHGMGGIVPAVLVVEILEVGLAVGVQLQALYDLLLRDRRFWILNGVRHTNDVAIRKLTSAWPRKSGTLVAV